MPSKTFKVFLVSLLTSLLLVSFSHGSYAQTEEDYEQLVREVQEQVENSQEEYDKAIEKSEEMEDTIYEMFDSNREVIEDGQTVVRRMVNFFAFGGIALLLLGIFLILLCLGGLIFDIVMIIDCSKRDFKDKGLWLAILIGGGLLNLGLVVALIYFFTVKKKTKKE
jgi:hypothetical protein